MHLVNNYIVDWHLSTVSIHYNKPLSFNLKIISSLSYCKVEPSLPLGYHKEWQESAQITGKIRSNNNFQENNIYIS